MAYVEKCPHPKEPLSGAPTAQIGGREKIILRVPNTTRCSFDAHFKDKGDNKRPNVVCEKVAKFG